VRPDPADLELVGAAVSALRRGRGPDLHPAAAAVRTRTGRVVTGLGLGGCAEPVAVGAALALGEKVVSLVAVRHVDADATRVTEPCPACRALLRRHAPGVRVLHLADGLRVAGVESLG
jgi:cytidine deaminase